tara:strand:- start:1407 stop:2486 length:1080 start_codon:yes stop_codon:yes gene_type:complete
MDDYNINSLTESRNEWTARLVTILYPFIIEGFKSIYGDAYKLCIENDEEEKYLMTFQNLLSQIPKWNTELIENEVSRIKNNSKCGYIEDLITCVHIIQLKALTCVRVGQNQKKVDIAVPDFNNFIHKIYILTARKLYSNIYLFQKNISPLEVQKHNREIELIVKECILCAIRDTIPLEEILRSYLDEVIEENVEVQEEIIPIEVENNEEDNMKIQETMVDEKENNTEKVNEPEKEKEKSSNNIIIEQITDDNDTFKIKKDDNLVIDDGNYGVMLDVNDLVSNKQDDDESKKDNLTEDTASIINPIANEVQEGGVSFSSDVNFNEEDDYNDKLKISDSAIELDNIETLDDPALNNIEILA